ncbi:MAG: hypothetical protein ABJM90_07070 [Paracoccaceae bacterium]
MQVIKGLSKRIAAIFLVLIVPMLMLGVQKGMTEVSLNQKTVHLSCDNAPQALCAALTKAVFKADHLTQTTTSSDADLILALVVTKREPTYLAARLDWTENKTKSVSGPEVELSVMDAELSDIALDQFADTLLSISKPPL